MSAGPSSYRGASDRGRPPERFPLDADDDLGLDGPPRGRHATTLGQGFGGVVLWTVLGSAVPGLGLVASGNAVVGVLVLFVIGLVGLAAGTFAVFGDLSELVASIAADLSSNLVTLAVGVAVVAVLWFALVVGTNLALRRYSDLTSGQNITCLVLVVALTAVVAMPAAQVAQNALMARDVIGLITDTGDANTSTAQPSVDAADPWEDVPRVNVLLMGGDSGANRQGVRPDTMIVASINTKTGNTVLLSLPRNLQKVPFPEGTQMAADYPEGYYCPERGAADACMLNGLWTFALDHADTYYKDYKNPGLEATRSGIEQTLGLEIDNYVMVNMKGFEQFINAIGGLTVYVTQRLPVGGSSSHPELIKGYIEVGEHHLKGNMALWYARSRAESTDYDRMRRQRCVIANVIDQASPAKIVTNLPKILSAVKSNLKTDITEEQYSAWLTLAQRVKGGKTTSLAFTDNVITTADPDFEKIQKLTKQAIKKSDKTASSGSSTGATSTGSTSTTDPSASSSASSTMQHDDVDASEESSAQDVRQVC